MCILRIHIQNHVQRLYAFRKSSDYIDRITQTLIHQYQFIRSMFIEIQQIVKTACSTQRRLAYTNMCEACRLQNG